MPPIKLFTRPEYQAILSNGIMLLTSRVIALRKQGVHTIRTNVLIRAGLLLGRHFTMHQIVESSRAAISEAPDLERKSRKRLLGIAFLVLLAVGAVFWWTRPETRPAIDRRVAVP